MSINNITDYSLVFSDNKIVIIPLDRELNPLDDEVSMFCSFYSKQYKTCKELSKDQTSSISYFRIGANRHVLFVPIDLFNETSLKTITSYLSRVFNIDECIDVLEPSNFSVARKLSKVLPNRLNVFSKVFI